MAHGLFHSLKHGDVHGARHNGALTLAGGLSTVARDGTSQIYVPLVSSQWTTLMAAAGLATGNPSNLWNMQESSGSLVDSIGSVSLAANNAPSYAQAVTGWSRLAVKMTDGTGNQRFSSSSASLPDLSATSALLLLYVGFTSTPGAVRGVASLGTTATSNALETRHNGGGVRVISGANTTNGAGTLSTQVRPWVLKVNVTGTSAVVYTDQEKITPVYGTMSGKLVQVGATGAAPANTQYLYGALFTGAAAELSDAQVKTLLQTLGWTIPWS